jgi:triosephosphate isomerase (TIM)
MIRKKKLVVGNWKMFPERHEEAKKIVAEVKKITPKLKKTTVVICPPFIYIPLFSKLGRGSLKLGAQNTNPESQGSFTGEVSVSQIEQFGVDFVIVGHSERRKMGETDLEVNKKIRSVINYGISPILCVGEAVHDHNGDYLDFIKNQIVLGLKGVEKKNISKVVIAYEPIWAVGAKEAMKPNDVHEMTIYIKKVLSDMYGEYAGGVSILYGGAVDKFNAEKIIKEGNVSGFLVGRQSLVPKDFVEIIKIVENC